MPKILSGADYLALPRSPETWLVKPLLPKGGTMLFYGDPKVGKSYAALQLALCLREGTEWLGFPCAPSRVVYIQLDTPRSLWADRLQALLEIGLDVKALDLADRETLETWPFDALNPEHAMMLKTLLAPLQADVVIIDTIREAHNGDEDKSTTMKQVVSSLVSMTQPAALIVVSHSKKPGEYGPDLINDNRGSGYVVGAMDAIVRFTPKGMHYVGRAVEKGSIKLVRQDTGLWEPEVNNMDELVEKVLADSSISSVNAKAVKLAELSGRSVDACRSKLRRH